MLLKQKRLPPVNPTMARLYKDCCIVIAVSKYDRFKSLSRAILKRSRTPFKISGIRWVECLYLFECSTVLCINLGSYRELCEVAQYAIRMTSDGGENSTGLQGENGYEGAPGIRTARPIPNCGEGKRARKNHKRNTRIMGFFTNRKSSLTLDEISPKCMLIGI